MAEETSAEVMVVALLMVDRWMVVAAVPDPITTMSEEDPDVRTAPVLVARLLPPLVVVAAAEPDEEASVLDASVEVPADDDGPSVEEAPVEDAEGVSDTTVEVGVSDGDVVVCSVEGPAVVVVGSVVGGSVVVGVVVGSVVVGCVVVGVAVVGCVVEGVEVGEAVVGVAVVVVPPVPMGAFCLFGNTPSGMSASTADMERKRARRRRVSLDELSMVR